MPAPIDPGHLRFRLELEEPVESPDGQGGVTLAWRAVTGLWAKIEPLVAAREEVAAGLRQVTRHRVTIRQRDGVTQGMRFHRLGRVLAIKTVVDPDETGRYFVCMCEEDGQ
jgi:SPP1 family predicted phage head-tail adaptor